MRIKFQYADRSEWEGDPAVVATSPDKGVIRMWAITDTGRALEFVYDDLYFVHWDAERHGWRVGSGTPKREFVIRDGQDGSETIEIPINLPASAVIRRGETVTDEAAVRFGLTDRPTARRRVAIEQGGCCS